MLSLWAMTFTLTGCSEPESEFDRIDSSMPAASVVVSPQEELVIERFCGYCHALPDPNSFAREDWADEVAQGFRFHHANPVEGIEIPSVEATVAFFEDRAPEQLDDPQVDTAEQDALFIAVEHNPESPKANAVSSIRYFEATDEIWACDMQVGTLFSAERGGVLKERGRPIQLLNPCRTTLVDLNNDHRPELLVADLGTFSPDDHNQGSAWSLSPDDNWQARRILESVGRVCDIQPGDFDVDGDLDLVVAEFGWRSTGSLHIVWNDGMDPWKWRDEILDSRHGAIDVPVVDLNNDGLLDIIALFGQEFEQVCAYINLGEGDFDRIVLYESGDPSSGSSGIQVVDVDLDGDLDLLHSNGDSFDSFDIKPFHGVRWLENRGEFPFAAHELCRMPGVHRTAAGDLDLDGDLDIVAVSLLPPSANRMLQGLPSIVWLEQQKGGNFERHVVEVDVSDHATCELVDWNDDGDLDLWVGHFNFVGNRPDSAGTRLEAATMFENRCR